MKFDIKKYENIYDMLLDLGWIENSTRDGMQKDGNTILYIEFMRGNDTSRGTYTRREFIEKMKERNLLPEDYIQNFNPIK